MPDELWLDSSIAFGQRRARTLAIAARARGVRMFVHAHIHLEQCRQVRVDAKSSFSARRIESYLEGLGIEVVSATLDRDSAEAFAAQLAARYPSIEDWTEAKLSAVQARLPSAELSKSVPMTTDWLVALEVERRGAHIAVEDQGEEWRHLRDVGKALSFDQALAWLEVLPSVVTPNE
jgi:hypothetical protein